MNSSIFTTMSTSSDVYDVFTRHDSKHRDGFITRLDKAPIRQKKITFFSAVALHVVLIICLTVLAVLTVQSCLQAPFPPSMRLAFALTQNVLLVAAFVALLRSTVIPFLLGECRLRYRFGFRDSEPLIRRAPRSIGFRSPSAGNDGEKRSGSNDAALMELRHSVQRLVDSRLLFYRPAALLSKYYWTPAYPALLDAYERLDSGNLDELDFDLAVWKQKSGRWTACQLWRLNGIMDEK